MMLISDHDLQASGRNAASTLQLGRKVQLDWQASLPAAKITAGSALRY